MSTNDTIFTFCDGEIPVYKDSYIFSVKHMFSDRYSMGRNDFLSKDDVKAINQYLDSLPCSHGELTYNTDAILRKWLQLSTAEQAGFYDMVYQENVDEKAHEILLREFKEAAQDRVKRTYCVECDYNKLSEMEKEPYYEKAKQVLKAEKEADGKGKVDDGSRFISDIAIIISVLNYVNYGTVDERSFLLYCRKMRPQLLMEPGMFDKHHFQQFLILEDRWRKLSKEKKEVYYKMDARKKLILTEMTKRELNYCNIANRLGHDEDKKEEYTEEAKRNRIQLVKDFPDFYDLIYEEANDGSFALQSNADQSVLEYEYYLHRYGPCRDAYWTIGKMIEGADENAFTMFKEDVCPHKNGLLNSILWDKWFELTESQQEEYYEKSDMKQWESKALFLYECEDNFKTHCECEFETFEKVRPVWIEKAKENGPLYDDEPEQDPPNDPNVWIEDLNSTYCPKFLWYYESMEDKAIYSHVYYNWLSVKHDPEVKEKRKIRVCRKFEEEFRNSPEIREQRYAEIRRNKELYDEAKKRFLSPAMNYKKEVEELRPKPDDADFDDSAEIWKRWRNLSDDEKAVYDEKAKQARMQLMEDFPDFNNYFYWEKSWWKDGDRLCDVIGENSDCADDDGNDAMSTDGNIFVFCDGNIPVFEDSYLFCNLNRSHSMGLGEFCSKDDEKAISKYRNSLPCPHGHLNNDENALLRKWVQLSTSEQAVFYDSVYQENVDEKAREFFLQESKGSSKNRVKRTYCLECDYNKLSEMEKEPYYEKARQILKEEKEADAKQTVGNSSNFISDRSIGLIAGLEEDNKEEVKENRIQLVKGYPDFYDLIHDGLDCSYSPLEEERGDEDSYSDYQYRARYQYDCQDDCFTVGYLAEIADIKAFEMFKNDVCGHKNGLKNSIIWDKWFELTESQQEQYYEKSDNKRWKKRAMVLYECGNNFNTFCACEFEKFEKDRQIWIEKAKGTYTPDAFVELQIPEDTNLWIEDLNSTYCPKFLWIYPSMEDKAIYSHVYYKCPEVKEQKYAEIRRNQELYDEAEKRVLSPGEIYKKEMEELRPDDDAEKIWETWRNLSDDEKAVYDEKAKQARMQLMQDFPDFNNYFYWEKSPSC
uniref:HMG box domain-containing protein n=1 Tax=Panagrellus redivivus TaxID=6233 RepID=A0A7E4W8I9_PANRE